MTQNIQTSPHDQRRPERYAEAVRERNAAIKRGDALGEAHWDEELDLLWYAMTAQERPIAEALARQPYERRLPAARR
jgi:hypothetical protein